MSQTTTKNIESIVSNYTAPTIVPTLPPIASLPAESNGPECNRGGVLYDAVLVVSSVLFVLYLAVQAPKNARKLWLRRRNSSSFVMISYYALLWIAALLNLSWSCLQAWQCSKGNDVGWNFLSLLTTSALLLFEISLLAFLLQEDYASAWESLARTFVVSGVIAGIDTLLKVIYIFGFGVPLFVNDMSTTDTTKWCLWFIHNSLLTAVYGFILFLRFSKWREKLPPRPAVYNYIIIMFTASFLALFASGLAVLGASFGIWLYNLTNVCYHSLYLPLCYFAFLADFFKEEAFLLDNAYYSEMRDAGFFDADWD